jgi:virginiamycin A acetyltransferase
MFMSLRDKLFLRRHLKNQFTSQELREFYRERYAIDVGMYSYGCFDSSRIARGTTIGRYCSFAKNTHILNGNHGLEFLSLHPYLFNVSLGCVETETIKRTQCSVEDDVWVGHCATILPSVSHVGRGAVIGAGAVVTRDIPRYAVVVGNPGRIIRYRFSDEIIEQIETTKWWEMNREELVALIRSNPTMVYHPNEYFRLGFNIESHE